MRMALEFPAATWRENYSPILPLKLTFKILKVNNFKLRIMWSLPRNVCILQQFIVLINIWKLMATTLSPSCNRGGQSNLY